MPPQLKEHLPELIAKPKPLLELVNQVDDKPPPDRAHDRRTGD